MTDQQKIQEDRLIKGGWTQWSETMADGRKALTPYWRYEGSWQWYINEVGQSEYINTERRYTVKQALRIEDRILETAAILAIRRAEAEQRQGISVAPKRAVSAAEAAARAAESVETIQT